MRRSSFGDELHRQCIRIAKRTGRRCRLAALQGASCCHKHGGHRQAYQAAPPGFISLRSAPSAVRYALAVVGLTEPLPVGVPWDPSPVVRGRIIEDERNRRLHQTTVPV